MDDSDDLTFRVNFGGDGVAKLQQRIMNKLKQFMGDYTDDTLVEYVIVLLKNGRRKVEAKNELNVFLGDDSGSFVSWLWDHLGSNLDLYVQHGESREDEGIKIVSLPEENTVKIDSAQFDYEADREKSDKLNRNRHIRELKSVVRNNDELSRIQRDEGHEVVHSKQSSRQISLRKRSRHDEPHQDKRDENSNTKINVTRRLLQSAVRDAVGTLRTSSSSSIFTTEPSLKRLRSVVDDPTTRIRSVSRMPNTLAVAIRAVADAAKDVTRLKSQSNVFDRIGRSNVVNRIIPGQSVEASIQDKITDDYMLESDGGDNDDDVSVHNNDASQSGTSKRSDNDLVMLQYSLDDSAAVVPDNNSGNIVNISVNVNTWKSPPSHYQEQKESLDMNENKALPAMADTQKEPQKTLPTTAGLYSTGRPNEDTDSRTIFVSNVHFAATKDSLSRHFNKFGDVLKVIIVTDAATGQPKGSAYVEFMRKEAAEHALSLDGTSFLSRILKVVKKSAVEQEAAPMTWPRGSQFGASRFGRPPFLRGVPSIYRPRLPIKAGARSMQWKRDAQPSPSDNTNPVPSPTARSLTYVRKESKTNVN